MLCKVKIITVYSDGAFNSDIYMIRLIFLVNELSIHDVLIHEKREKYLVILKTFVVLPH